MREYTIFDLLSGHILHQLGDMIKKADVKLNEKEVAMYHLMQPTFRSPSSKLFSPQQIKKGISGKGPESIMSKQESQIGEILKKNYAAWQFCLNILRQNIQKLRNDAILLAARKKKLMKLRQAIRDLIRREVAEKNRADVQRILDERFKLEYQMLEEIRAAKESISVTYDELSVVEENLTKNMEEIKKVKHATLDEHIQVYAETLDQYTSPTGTAYFKTLSKQEKQGFLRDFFYHDRKLERTIKKEEKKQKTLEADLDKLFKERRDLLHQLTMQELQGHIQVNPEVDRLRPQRITTMHGMERKALSNDRVRELDAQIQALSQQLKTSVDKMAKAKTARENLLTETARKHHLEPLANASEEEKAHFLEYCKENQEKVCTELDRWSDLRQEHKKQRNKITDCHRELNAEYQRNQNESEKCEQFPNHPKMSEERKNEMNSLLQASHALDKAWSNRERPEPKLPEQKYH